MEWKTGKNPVDYPAAIDFMENRVRQIRAAQADEMVWLLEHPALYTAGSSAKTGDMLDNQGFPVYQTGRGGQYTYHGPGQRVAYIMLDLKKRIPDVHLFVKALEHTVIHTLKAFGVKGETREGRVGVWVQHEGREKKIAAIGIRIRQWVSYHGVAVNIKPDLSHYQGIVPCGIREYGITSLDAMGIKATLPEFDLLFRQAFEDRFCSPSAFTDRKSI